MKTIFATLILASLSVAQAQTPVTTAPAPVSGKVADMASAQAINTVCTEEAATAKCGNDKVGSGLLKCLRDYKKANKDFVITDSCEASLKQLRRDVRAKRK